MSERWLKAELHSHCNLDPHDYNICDCSPESLIREAARLGYDVLAITCHNLDIWTPRLAQYAEGWGVTLIPGMEVSVDGRWHCLVYNFRTGAENLNSLAKMQALRRDNTLVVVPHPFYPAPCCLGSQLEQNLSAFDALEYSGFYTRGIDFNRKARKLAAQKSTPLIGNADVHYLWQLDKTFSWIHAKPTVDSILTAIRQGRVRVETKPLTLPEAVRWWTSTLSRELSGSGRLAAQRLARFRTGSPVQS